MSKTRNVISVLDEKTGELKDYIEIRNGDTLQTKEQKDYWKTKKLKHADKTEFIWVNYLYNSDFYSFITSENLTRLMYFSTFTNNDCFVMQDDDVKSMLRINPNQVKAFRDEFYNKIITKEGSRLYLDSALFGKGEMKDNEKDYLRLFTGTVRLLYENCKKSSEHAYLSYFFRMIPFVNRQTNILCCNQEEQDREHIAFMTVTEFLEKIGKTHSSRIKKQLQSYRIDGELVIGFFNNLRVLDPKGKYAVVNPLLYYGGDRNKQNYKFIRELFEKEKAEFCLSK